MNGTRDTSGPGPADNDGGLDPRQAARLLERTGLRARRGFEPYPPWLSVVRAVMVLAVCGVVWLSVRGQHPYRGPTPAAVIAVYAFVVIHSGAVTVVAGRARAGVRRGSRLSRAEIAAMAVAWAGVFVVMGVLAGAGVSRAIVYGVYPATVPLIVAGLTWAGIMAARANRRACATGLAAAAVGAAGVFAGPAGAWVVVGVGLCLVLLGSAAVTARRQHPRR